MQLTIEETARRRQKQMEYNREHGITPTAVRKRLDNPLSALNSKETDATPEYRVTKVYEAVSDPVVEKMTPKQLEKAIEKTKRDMLHAAKELNFLEAARLRDEMLKMQQLLDSRTA